MVDLSKLAAKVAPIEQSTEMLVDELQDLLPDTVIGRVLQLDGDSAAYKCAGKDGTPLSLCKKRFRQFVEDKRLAAGAEFVNVCFTGGDGSKGGRYLTAVTKPYQEQRIGIQKPENLPALRAWALNEYQGTALDIRSVLEVRPDRVVVVTDTSEEADDSMTQLHQQYLEKGLHELSVISAEDKDLFMNGGLFLDWNTHELKDCETPYGYIEPYTTPGGTNKILGRGKAFFFAQLLVGDSADNIPGLPYFTPAISAVEFPTSDLREQCRRLKERTMPSGKPLSEAQIKQASEKVKKLVRTTKSRPCGPVAVYEYLSSCTSEKEALTKVLKAYCEYYGKDEEVLNPHTGEKEIWQPQHFLLEQARLLWMRRFYGEDVKDYFKEILNAST
jgi:hypothetical protein